MPWLPAREAGPCRSERDHVKVKSQNGYYLYAFPLPLKFQPYCSSWFLS